MSTLKERLSTEIKTAMKGGDKSRLTFARNLHAAIRKKEIDDRIDLDDAGVVKIATTLVKQRRESIEQYEKGGRADLVAQETAELQFLQTFLPEQLSEEQVKKFITDAIAESKAQSQKDLGAVMKVLLPKVQGKADGKLISQWVREKLGS